MNLTGKIFRCEKYASAGRGGLAETAGSCANSFRIVSFTNGSAGGDRIQDAREHVRPPDALLALRQEEFAMILSVFVGTSVDGFIARSNGGLDFLDEGGDEPHGYDEFIAGIDTIVIGRLTFETVLAFPAWPYGDKRVVALSSRPLDFSKVRGGVVEQMAGPPADIVAKLAASGARNVYVDGGITIQRFLRAGLIQRLTITRVPVLIGEGVPLFGALPKDVRLRHVATQHYAGGLVKSEYRIDS